MTRWNRALSALVAVGALAATGACTLFGGEGDDSPAPGGEDAITDEAGLAELINENNRLIAEVNDVEVRLEQDCLEDQGFHVHDRYKLFTWEATDQGRLVVDYPYADFLPDADTASEWGFGAWAGTDEAYGSAEADEYYDAVLGEDNTEPEIDNSAWDALPIEEQQDWSRAYYGDAYEQIQEGADGMNPFGGETAGSPPKPGGCQLEMIEALYGEPEQVERTEGDDGQGGTTWQWGPQNPLDAADWDAMYDDYRTRAADPEQSFSDCLFEHDLGEWEFDESGRLPIWDYFTWVYNAESPQFAEETGESLGTPPLPEDLPEDFDGRKAFEIETAVGFTDCGESTGFREAAKAAWDGIQLDYYLSVEQELFSYQEAMNDLLLKAQELVDA
ncbi:hypothetical protein [Glycomyces buryatensis]|uniref:Uncharacterized protein n=1 Tax=Glycomyces buryatensis TaxID=2570927 RepID=A0A4S8QF21_9ACTN|nr:hypothetical protein [Glycomyces buryatensis]THV43008.1 hypothetical protein FAB82_03375 [Glycomyces buryatensis]